MTTENLMKTSKRAQHETLGFVLIILIVVVISVIFLGIAIRKPTTLDTTDAQIGNFLVASAGTTTQCYTDNEPNYRTLGQLINDCYQLRPEVICSNNTSACKVLNSTYSEMLKKFQPTGTLSYYKLSFQINATGSSQLINIGNDIVFGTKAGCTITRAGMNYIYTDGGTIIEELEICQAA